MPLARGDKLGPYEILELIGKGGMGGVYRAHDKNLARDVAIDFSAGYFESTPRVPPISAKINISRRARHRT
jgi:serine/threonine protein kinase